MTESRDILFKVPESEYGDSYKADYLRMYQDYVSSADSISERRNKANTYFLSASTALLTAASYFTGDENRLIWIVALAGIAFSGAWWLLITSYRNLNSAKFLVIHKLEQKLPFAAYDEEWEQLSRGRDARVHVPLSKVESAVPIVFGIMHAIVFVVNFF